LSQALSYDDGGLWDRKVLESQTAVIVTKTCKEQGKREMEMYRKEKKRS
jgi:hypothetical protein